MPKFQCRSMAEMCGLKLNKNNNMKKTAQLTKNTITLIENAGVQSFPFTKEVAISLLEVAQRYDLLDYAVVEDISDFNISQIQLPSLWQIIRRWSFWKEVLRELLTIIVYIIIKTQRKS